MFAGLTKSRLKITILLAAWSLVLCSKHRGIPFHPFTSTRTPSQSTLCVRNENGPNESFEMDLQSMRLAVDTTERSFAENLPPLVQVGFDS